jgi:FtsP/CotA-like multicopper oxidase with cupredoxin domain
MNARATRVLAMAGALAVAGSGPIAGFSDLVTDPPRTAASATKAGPGGRDVNATLIMGAAWHADNSPIPYARLRLRNAATGRMHAHTIANELGQFAFRSVETGSYIVELVTEAGKVLTVGQTFSVAPGETVATFVRLGTRVPWFNGFFANAAAAVSATAAATGVTAVAPEQMTCASPPCSTGSQ